MTLMLTRGHIREGRTGPPPTTAYNRIRSSRKREYALRLRFSGAWGGYSLGFESILGQSTQPGTLLSRSSLLGISDVDLHSKVH